MRVHRIQPEGCRKGACQPDHHVLAGRSGALYPGKTNQVSTTATNTGIHRHAVHLIGMLGSVYN